MTKSTNLLKAHAASWLHDKRPPLQFLLRYIEKGDDASDHWLWLVDSVAKFPRRLSGHGHATISWSPKVDVRLGIFSVARVLIEHFKGPFPERSSFTLLCGRSDCVNPDHWMWVEPVPRYRFDPSEFGWRVAERRTGRFMTKRVLLAVRDQHGVSHTVPAPPHPTSRFVAMCESLIIPEVSFVLATNAVITCKGGC
jgi:hypothetical protein